MRQEVGEREKADGRGDCAPGGCCLNGGGCVYLVCYVVLYCAHVNVLASTAGRRKGSKFGGTGIRCCGTVPYSLAAIQAPADPIQAPALQVLPTAPYTGKVPGCRTKTNETHERKGACGGQLREGRWRKPENRSTAVVPSHAPHPAAPLTCGSPRAQVQCRRSP